MSETQSIVKAGQFDLSNMEHIGQFSESLQKFIKGNNLSMTIQNNEYVLVDGWKFAAMNFGLSVIPSRPEIDSNGDVYLIQKDWNCGKSGKNPWWKTEFSSTYKEDFDAIWQKIEKSEKANAYRMLRKPHFRYKCDADVIRVSNGQKLSYGFAICSNSEAGKDGFDEYAVASMAQTRAIAKAIRNLLGFVMKAAGYMDTPAEEVTEGLINSTSGNSAIVVTDEVASKINSFTDKSELTDWAMEQTELSELQEFKDLVNSKFVELKTGENDK